MSEKYNSLFSIVVTAKMGHALQTRARGGEYRAQDEALRQQKLGQASGRKTIQLEYKQHS